MIKQTSSRHWKRRNPKLPRLRTRTRSQANKRRMRRPSRTNHRRRRLGRINVFTEQSS